MSYSADKAIYNKIQSLSSLKSTLSLLNKTTEDHLFVCSICKKTVWFFSDFHEIFNVKSDADGGISLNNMLNITHSIDRDTLQSAMEDIKSGKTNLYNVECRLINKNNEPVWISCKGVAHTIDNELYVTGRMSHQELSHMFNPLTGLFNQFRLMSDLKELYKGDISGYLMLLSIDELSAINLNHGRSYGNALLKTIASFMEDLPEIDAVYHNERSYFTSIINTDNKNKVTEIYTAIRNAVKDKCTVSAGVVPMNKDYFSDENSLYDAAKIVSNKTKDHGRNTLLFFEEEEFKKTMSSASLLHEMQKSVSQDFAGFNLVYQPQLMSNIYSLYGAEALLRYTSESGKKVFPDEFIPILENSKLIIPVGMWVLKTALNQCKLWQKYVPNMHISVNFSMVQLRDESIVDDILRTLHETDMPGECLTIEITESIPIHEMELIVSIIKQLKSNGIQVAIDDFGTGYSNLGYLNRMNVDEIKIDRMFVKDIDKSLQNCNVVSQAIEFAKQNAMRVCCEGVETAKEVSILEMYSPHLLQGYLFDKPLTPEEFASKYFDHASEDYLNKESFIKELTISRNKSASVQFNHKDILRETNMGLWVMHKSHNNQDVRLFFDETMERIMGLEEKLTPEKYYDFWHSRIKKDHVKYVDENFDLMTTVDKVVQLEYPWEHPTLGEVIVRSNGKVTNKTDNAVVIEGYHRIMSNIKEA